MKVVPSTWRTQDSILSYRASALRGPQGLVTSRREATLSLNSP